MVNNNQNKILTNDDSVDTENKNLISQRYDSLLNQQSNVAIKKRKFVKLLLVISVITLIITSICIVLKTRNNSSTMEVTDFSGKFEYKGVKLLLYPLDNNNVFYTINGDIGIFQGTAKINGNQAEEIDKFDKDTVYHFDLIKQGIKVTINGELNNINGLYTKKGEYSTEEFYKDNIGEPKYIDSKYNGIYKNGDSELIMYQTKQNDIQISINKGSGLDIISWSKQITINSDGTLTEENLFDDELVSKIDFNNNTINFEYNGDDEIFNQLNGTYTKEKTLTLNDIINICYGTYNE